MSNDKVTFASLAITKDTGDPVLRVSKGSSFMDVILDTEDKCVSVWYVDSKNKGDMDDMLTETVSQLATKKVRFISPLSSDDKKEANKIFEKAGLSNKFKFAKGAQSNNIKEVLDGFEEKELDTPQGKVTVLEGEWDIEE